MKLRLMYIIWMLSANPFPLFNFSLPIRPWLHVYFRNTQFIFQDAFYRITEEFTKFHHLVSQKKSCCASFFILLGKERKYYSPFSMQMEWQEKGKNLLKLDMMCSKAVRDELALTWPSFITCIRRYTYILHLYSIRSVGLCYHHHHRVKSSMLVG